ncbi:MAG: GIY-YIG nuclease family protein [Candidatus Alcyoniella australis]|nr:GIY-YIG nuclease family protein [Candidatus Alcyoniella australis]
MYVYLLKSQNDLSKRYIGVTADIKRRLSEHNAGKSQHTAKYSPWKVVVAVWFDDKSKAVAFEKYLKIGSGHAFSNRHFW